MVCPNRGLHSERLRPQEHLVGTFQADDTCRAKAMKSVSLGTERKKASVAKA